MPAVTCAPDRADRPTPVAVGVAIRAARGRHDHPAALSVHEVAHEVVRELIATWFGHRCVIPRTSDKHQSLVSRNMSNRHLAAAAATVWGIAVLVGVFVAAPLWFGINIDAGLIINALAALGSLAAAVAAVWIATTDRKQRQQEQEETDRKQAGLVRLTSRWADLGTPKASLVVTVKNFGKLPIVDVAVTHWAFDGHDDVTPFWSPGPIEAVLPYTGSPDAAGVLTVKPLTEATKIAMEGEPHPSGVTVVGNQLKNRPTVGSGTGSTVTIQFTDAGEKRWRRSNKGLLERAF
jgi:hypothetical protein